MNSPMYKVLTPDGVRLFHNLSLKEAMGILALAACHDRELIIEKQSSTEGDLEAVNQALDMLRNKH